MDIKYVIAGINLVVLGVLITIYGYLVTSTQLVGVASSIILIGIVVLVMGYTYIEPTTSLLIDYSREVSRFASLVLEDMRLSNILPSTIVEDNKIYIVLSSVRVESIENLSTGVNLVSGEPVILIPTDSSPLFEGATSSLYEVESRLRDKLIGEYGLCTTLELRSGDDVLSLRLIGLDSRLLEIELAPLNPLDVVVVSTLSGALGKGLFFERRVLEGNEYRAEFRVIG